jgi:membrane-bound lytic murein transglycosylase D
MEFRSAFPAAVLLGTVLGVAAAAERGEGAESAASAGGLVREASAAIHGVTWDIPIVRNEAVDRFVGIFSERQPDRMALYLKRSGRYEGMIRGKLRERGMPEDLLYLSMIESGFNTTARSKASAVGLWQFIEDTGRRYGLRVDAHVDERRHPEKATDAALRYLSDLHGQFGSWYLAAAAYNSGEGRVGRVMRQVTGEVRGSDEDFWRIRSRLPAETREYVPLMVAAALVAKEPEKYGLSGVARWSPIETEEVDVAPSTPLAQVAEAVGVTEEELKRLNPHLLRSATPPGADDYAVVIPAGRGDRFAAEFEGVRARAAETARLARAEAAASAAARARVASARPAPARPATARAATTRRHTVRNGENLSVIARRYNTSVGRIQSANGMGSRSRIQAGQRLLIPS